MVHSVEILRPQKKRTWTGLVMAASTAELYPPYRDINRPKCAHSGLRREMVRFAKKSGKTAGKSSIRTQLGQCQQLQPDQFQPAQCQQGWNPLSQRALPETKSGEQIMLEATSCSFAGLCFCLLAISAAAVPSITIFCCTVLPLLLFWMSVICSLQFLHKPSPSP